MAKRKRNYTWVGGGEVKIPLTDASSTLAGVIELVPATLSTAPVGERTDCLIEAVYVHVSTRRIALNDVDALGLIVWVGNVQEGGNDPAATLDAISTLARAYGNPDILIMEPIPVPPLLGTSDLLSFTADAATLVSKHTFMATRKLNRARQVLCLQINSDVSSVVTCFVQARVLLSYGS